MKKIWFFVEGDTEESFISNLILKRFYESFRQEKDLLKFVRENVGDDTRHWIYCENCQSVDKIPHRINERYYLIENSGSDYIIVVCDVEQLRCHSMRRHDIESRLDDSIDQTKIRYAFFNPMIESAYGECPEVIKRIIELEYREKFNPPTVPEIAIPDNLTSHSDLKNYFKKFNLKYRETKFAEKFFPRINYKTCPNKILNRIYKFLEDI